MARRLRALTLGYLLIAALGLAIGAWLYETHPELRRSLIHEGGFVQSATGIFFFAAFLLGLLSLRRLPAPGRRTLAWIPAASAFGWLEESDYGERLFGFHPAMLYHKHIDSVHSLISALLVPFKKSGHADLLQSLLYVVLGVLAIRQRALQRLAAYARRHPALLFAILATAFVLLAQLIDDRVLRWRDSHVMEEILELDGSLGMLIASALMGRSAVPAGEPLRAQGPVPIPVALPEGADRAAEAEIGPRDI